MPSNRELLLLLVLATWHVICQVMRFQKLQAQISAHCESSHLRAGGEEAESLTGHALAGGDCRIAYWQIPSLQILVARRLQASQCFRNGGQLQLLSMAGKREGRQFVLFKTTAWQ